MGTADVLHLDGDYFQTTTMDGWHVLQLAAWTMKPGQVQALLRSNPTSEIVSQQNSGCQGLTALHLASWNGDEETCKLLLDAGAELDKRAMSGVTPLMYAKQRKHANIMKLLESRTPTVKVCMELLERRDSNSQPAATPEYQSDSGRGEKSTSITAPEIPETTFIESAEDSDSENYENYYGGQFWDEYDLPEIGRKYKRQKGRSHRWRIDNGFEDQDAGENNTHAVSEAKSIPTDLETNRRPKGRRKERKENFNNAGVRAPNLGNGRRRRRANVGRGSFQDIVIRSQRHGPQPKPHSAQIITPTPLHLPAWVNVTEPNEADLALQRVAGLPFSISMVSQTLRYDPMVPPTPMYERGELQMKYNYNYRIWLPHRVRVVGLHSRGSVCQPRRPRGRDA
jgi:hypothetical protein